MSVPSILLVRVGGQSVSEFAFHSACEIRKVSE